MSTVSLRDLRSNPGNVARAVTVGNEEAIIFDGDAEVAVLINLLDYERLHEHADTIDAERLRDMRTRFYEPITLPDMLRALGVAARGVGVA